MNPVAIFISSTIGTSCMTLFSYGMSVIRGKQFREPELMNDMLVRAGLMRYTSSKKHLAGWTLHYGIGLAFVLLYYGIAALTGLTLTFSVLVIAGAISGLLGIAAWHLAFKFHPNPPATHRKEFYVQLEIAHIVFGATAYAGVAFNNL